MHARGIGRQIQGGMVVSHFRVSATLNCIGCSRATQRDEPLHDALYVSAQLLYMHNVPAITLNNAKTLLRLKTARSERLHRYMPFVFPDKLPR